jgi:hypothetical protein
MEQRRVVFISYWTKPYKKSAERLKASLDALGLEHDINEIPDKGWTANVRHKPTYILEMLKKHKDAYAVVWIDADGDVIQRPSLFFEIEEDMACRFKPITHKKCEELLSGTMLWKPSAIHAVEKWIEALRKAPMNLLTPEQQVLHRILDTLGISYAKLPETYCHILRDRGRSGAPSDSVVVHYQFSRETRYGRTPAAHLSDPTHLGKRERPPSRNKKSKQDLAHLPRKRSMAKGRPLPKPDRIPAAVKLQSRRARVLASRREHNEQEKAKAKADAAIRLAAGFRRRKEAKILAHMKRAEEIQKEGPVGGVVGNAPDKAQAAYAHAMMSQMPQAAELDGVLGSYETILVLGNSPTIDTIPKDILWHLPVMGCNRALRWGKRRPDFLVIADREPYCQERDSRRIVKAVSKGTLPILSDSLFDPTVLLRGPYSNKARRAQPIPDFKAYIYRVGPKRKRWTYDDVVRGSVILPCNFSTFEAPIVTCQNIAGSMLQAAACLGAKRIAVCGIEMEWPRNQPSHFFGDGREVGAYPQDGAIDKILAALKQLRDQAKKRGIEIINISPVKRTPFSRVFKLYDQKKFFDEARLLPKWEIRGDIVGDRQNVEDQEIVSAIMAEAEALVSGAPPEPEDVSAELHDKLTARFRGSNPGRDKGGDA